MEFCQSRKVGTLVCVNSVHMGRGSVCLKVVSAREGGLHPGGWADTWDTTGHGQQAGGTHATGMF